MPTNPEIPSRGPLAGIKVVEFAGIGPGPFCGMLLADMGAEITLLERAGGTFASQLFGGGRKAVANRGKKSLCIDLKHPDAKALVFKLIAEADVLIEGFRPGVMERLGFGPDECLSINPRLIYGRMTGWGQTGPLAPRAGHDANYAAIAGVLDTGRRHGGAPWAPPTLVGDMGGGGLMLAWGIACALIYDVYQCADDEWISVCPLEPQFYKTFVERLGLANDPDFSGKQYDTRRWPVMKERLTAIFRTEPREHWNALFDDTDDCVWPVLSMTDAPSHPHNLAREAFVEVAGVQQPAPAPRLSRTPGAIQSPPPLLGEHSRERLAMLGLTAEEIDRLAAAGVVSDPIVF